MTTMKRIRNTLKGWQRLFKQNWALFKASRIGLIGLGIMITFVIIALTAPFMGLRDPLWWRAPDSDIVQVTKWWPTLTINNSQQFGYVPLNHSTAVRFATSGGVATDRIYVVAGTKLFALNPYKGTNDWTSSIDLASLSFAIPPFTDPKPSISADPVVANFGTISGTIGAHYWVYLGTTSGAVYGIHDTARSLWPAPTPERIGIVDGTVTGMAAFSGDDYDTYSSFDAVAVSTSKGSLYLWQVDETGHHGPYNISVSTKAAHVAGNPMRGTGPYPLISPAFYYTQTDRTRPFIYVGSEDGYMTQVDISDIANPTLGWRQPVAADDMWSTAPMVRYVTVPPRINDAVVIAAMDDGNLTAKYAVNGTDLPWWGGARRVKQGTAALQWEREKMTQPYFIPDSTELLVGSMSGHAYSVDYLKVVPPTGQLEKDFIQPNWFFRDTSWPEGTTYVATTPSTYIGTFAFVASNHAQDPPGPAGDIGTVFALNINDGTQSWSVTFDSAILGAPVPIEGEQDRTKRLYVGTIGGSEYAYDTTGLYMIPAPPSWVQEYESKNTYILGLDNRGRDIWSQWVWGSRIALYVGFLAAGFSISIGTTMGLVAGYFGGKIDTVLMRFTDVILVIPGLPLIITLASVLGASVNNLILVIAIVGWPGVARVIRSQVLSLKERPFIESARVTGASHARIMGKHILPNVLPLAFLYMTFAVSGAILSEASISFIGLGDIQTVSWGRMLQDVTQSQALKAWWWLIPPGLAITLVSLGFFLIGRAFDEIVNPRLRKR